MQHVRLEHLDPTVIKPRKRAWRVHPEAQRALLRRSIKTHRGVIEPPLIDSENRVVCGSAIVEAAIAEGVPSIPVVRAEHLSDEELRAYAIAANRLADLAGYDEALLAEELQDLAALIEAPDLSGLGFEPAELDRLLGLTEIEMDARADEVPPLRPDKPIARLRDVWEAGPHRMVCGNALDPACCALLMQDAKAQLTLTDPPYNLPAKAFSGNGRFKHSDFLQAHGEMTPGQYTRFLTEAMRRVREHLVDGALNLFSIDGKHMLEMLRAESIVFGPPKNIITWIKHQGGQGSLWRSQTEFITCFKHGTAPHPNNVMLGKYGRNRTNAWHYKGMNTPSAERDSLLALHPTCKSVELLSDAILDVTTQGSIVLDTFAGSGSLTIAADLVKRRAFTMELDPLFVDVALRRARNTLNLNPVRLRDGARLSELEDR